MRFAMMMTIGVLVASAQIPCGYEVTAIIQAPACPPLSPPTAFGQFLDLRVDGDNGSPTGDGSGWGLDAYKYLQDALADAADHPPDVTVRLLVAATDPSNHYRPDRDAANPDGTADRGSTFLLNFSNVQLLGGFPPGGGDLEDRDPALYETVLSGLLAQCGDSNVGDCFQPNGTPLCDNAECCEAVCTVDPDCCEVAWDQACVDLAFTVCGSCGDPGSGDCLEANGTPGCEDAACCEIVCAATPECCTHQWDQACANFANLVCGVCGEPGSGSCFEPNGTPGCEDLDCCAVVCELDPLCCLQPWSQSCADLAIQLCDPPLEAGDPLKVYHVMMVDGVDDTVRIEGFKITNGLADGGMIDSLGAGMLILNASPAVVRVTFTENSAPGHGGGAMHIGGASDPIVVYTSFIRNTGREAGALHTESGIAGGTFVNCLFSGNASQIEGGAINPGGNGDVNFINCAFADNSVVSAVGGGAIFTEPSGSGAVNLTNCILWGNLAGGNPNQIEDSEGEVTVKYSDVEGGWGDPMDMNIDDDPLFVDPGNGDYRLSPGSPCIDAADNTAVPKGFVTDLDASPRFIEDPNTLDTGLGDCPIVDMGSYEFQEGVTDCCPGDLDGSGDVGVKDLLILLGAWGPCPPKEDCPADFDDSGDVGVKDLLVLLGAWGPCP